MMRTRKGHKVYPLTVAQKFHLYYAPHCPNMAVLNIGTSLTRLGSAEEIHQRGLCEKRGYARPFRKG